MKTFHFKTSENIRIVKEYNKQNMLTTIKMTSLNCIWNHDNTSRNFKNYEVLTERELKSELIYLHITADDN